MDYYLKLAFDLAEEELRFRADENWKDLVRESDMREEKIARDREREEDGHDQWLDRMNPEEEIEDDGDLEEFYEDCCDLAFVKSDNRDLFVRRRFVDRKYRAGTIGKTARIDRKADRLGFRYSDIEVPFRHRVLSMFLSGKFDDDEPLVPTREEREAEEWVAVIDAIEEDYLGWKGALVEEYKKILAKRAAEKEPESKKKISAFTKRTKSSLSSRTSSISDCPAAPGCSKSSPFSRIITIERSPTPRIPGDLAVGNDLLSLPDPRPRRPVGSRKVLIRCW